MSRNQGVTNSHEKKRISDEIDAQIREYLKQGGEIDVLGEKENARRAAIGSVWHGQDELSSMGE